MWHQKWKRRKKTGSQGKLCLFRLLPTPIKQAHLRKIHIASCANADINATADITRALYLIFSTNGRWQSKQARVPLAKDAFGCFALNCSWLHRTAHWPLALAQQSHSSANDTVEKMCKSESWCKNWVQRQFPASACSVTAALLRHRRTTHRRNHRRCSTQPLPQQIHKYKI